MADILTPALYPQVRAALDSSVDEITLPDASIGLDLFAGEAEREIKRRDPSWASRTGDAANSLKLAAVYWCAALIAPSLATPNSYAVGEVRITRSSIDRAKQAEGLRQRAIDALANIITTTTSTKFATALPVFALASGRRGVA